MSLVVGEAIAYKRIFKPISPCKNNWEFVCRSETISDRRIMHIQCKQLLLRVSWWNSFWPSSWRLTWRLDKPRTEQAGVAVCPVAEDDLAGPSLDRVQGLRLLACDTGMPYRARILKHRLNNSLVVVDQVFLRYTSGAFEFLKKPETLSCLRSHCGNVVGPF